MIFRTNRSGSTVIYLLLLAGALLISSCHKNAQSSASEQETDWEVQIWVVTDIHYLADKLYDQGPLFTKMNREGDGKNTGMLNSILAAFISEIKRERPSVLLVTGDLTFHGEKQSHRELAGFFKKIEDMGTEVYTIPGNHDLNNPWARKYQDDQAFLTESVKPEQFVNIYKNFGYSGALSYDKASLSYIIEPLRGIRILMLDSNKYLKNEILGSPEAGGFLSNETRFWIKEQAETARRDGCKLIVAMHHSLIGHNVMVSRGYTIDDSETLLPFFASLGVRLSLSGHIHIQDIISRETQDGPVYDIATGAFSVYPHGYGTLNLSSETWIYRSREVDVERWAVDNGSGDDKLIGFRSYSRDYFGDFSRRLVLNVLEGYSFDESDNIAAAAETLNMNFFAGREEDNPANLETELVELFHGKGSFLQGYLKSIVSDSPPGDNFLEIRNP